VLVILGPTASGKTEVALRVAGLVRGEIVSADSRQIYKGLTIGTAKPSPAQLSAVRHHFVDELSPDVEFNAGEFGVQGRERVSEILSRLHTPIVVGGSGFYVQSLIDGFFEGPGADREIRATLEARLRRGELQEMTEELRRVDPESAGRIDTSNPRRIMRALEVYHLTGVPLSAFHRDKKVVIDLAPVMFGLEWDRTVLYERINRRCDEMLESGLLDEVNDLAVRGYSPERNNALNTVGYAEAFACLRGEISREEMTRLFKQNSRRYAKRQLTWFRRDGRIEWVRMGEEGDADAAAAFICRRFGSGA
jgi:tRNA dimethylallyltransferase